MRQQKQKSIKEFNFKKGILVATFSGMMSACFSFGFQAGNPINKPRWPRHRTLWTGLPALVGDFARRFHHEFHLVRAVEHQEPHRLSIPRLARQRGTRASRRHGQRRTRPGDRAAGQATDLKIPVLANYLFSALAGTLLVFPIFFLHDGREADGQLQFRLVDAAHGEHHYFQHDVGLDFPRMERVQQKAPDSTIGRPAALSGPCRCGADRRWGRRVHP